MAPPALVLQFGTGGVDVAADVATDAGGDVLVVGQTTAALPGQTRTSRGGPDAFVRRVGPGGEERWTRQFGAASPDGTFSAAALNRVSLDPRGNVYVFGTVDGLLPGEAAAGGTDAFVRKYTPGGTLLWTRQFGTPGDDSALGLGVDARGDVYVVGRAVGVLPGAPGADAPAQVGESAYVRRYTADGAPVWTRQFAALEQDPLSGAWRSGSSVTGAAVDAQGNVCVAGSTSAALDGQPQVGPVDAYVRRYTPDGAVAWTRQFGTGQFTSATGVGVDAGGHSYVVGYARGTFPDQTAPGQAGVGGSAFLAKLGPDGTALWTRTFGVSGDRINGVAASPAGSVFVVGSTAGAGESDLLLLEYAADGNPLPARFPGTPGPGASAGFDNALSVRVDPGGSVALAGITDGTFSGQASAGGTDALVIRVVP